MKQYILVLLFATFAVSQNQQIHPAPGLGDYDIPFFPEGTYRSDIQSPGEYLGFTFGSRPVSHSEVLAYLDYLATLLPNASLYDYGTTFEGRRLVYFTVTSKSNAANIENIRDNIRKLSDPRKLKSEQTARKIIETSPAVAWMGYSIHGDELSSTDAALQLAYQILAGRDKESENIRNNLLVCIEPLQNPDGRMRFLTQYMQFNSVVPSTDTQSLHHRGLWPSGRGNHYLFDLNRDWFALVHPETRAKVRAMLSWYPQFVVDCHEMGAFDTYLFNPPREPFNPFLPDQIHKWWDIFAKDQAVAFNQYGWSYYTREWNEETYPGYGSSWPIYLGAVGILYEQAGVDGSQVKRPDGTIMTYRETIHHQFISSFANLATAAKHRKELLNDFYDVKVSALDRGRMQTRNVAFLFPPGENRGRLERLASTLLLQDIEVEQSTKAFNIRSVVGRDGENHREIMFPQGTLIVRLRQPNRKLIEAILTFDIRFSNNFLKIQRKSRLKYGKTKLYDATGWSLALAYDLDVYYSESVPAVKTVPFTASEKAGKIIGKSPQMGYLFSGADDRALLALAGLMEKGVKVWCARESIKVEGQTFPRGSFLIRIEANREIPEQTIENIAKETGITFYGVDTGLVTEGPDLGGREFQLLIRPRIALVGGSSVSTYGFGITWHLLDSQINIPVSTLDVSTLSGTDLEKYNVLVLPDPLGGPLTYKRLLGDSGTDKLQDWIKNGGTLITMESATAFMADTSSGLSTVRQKSQVLKKVHEYTSDLYTAREAESPKVDSMAVWEGQISEKKEELALSEADLSRIEEVDILARKLSPQGVIVKVNLDSEHWLSYGCGDNVPILVNSSFAFLAKGDVEVVGRLADVNNIRLSGLLWPEARKRWSETVWASRESLGKGQLILFASQPNFRAYFHGGERILLNALLLGPGFGSQQTVEW